MGGIEGPKNEWWEGYRKGINTTGGKEKKAKKPGNKSRNSGETPISLIEFQENNPSVPTHPTQKGQGSGVGKGLTVNGGIQLPC